MTSASSSEENQDQEQRQQQQGKGKLRRSTSILYENAGIVAENSLTEKEPKPGFWSNSTIYKRHVTRHEQQLQRQKTRELQRQKTRQELLEQGGNDPAWVRLLLQIPGGATMLGRNTDTSTTTTSTSSSVATTTSTDPNHEKAAGTTGSSTATKSVDLANSRTTATGAVIVAVLSAALAARLIDSFIMGGGGGDKSRSSPSSKSSQGRGGSSSSSPSSSSNTAVLKFQGGGVMSLKLPKNSMTFLLQQQQHYFFKSCIFERIPRNIPLFLTPSVRPMALFLGTQVAMETILSARTHSLSWLQTTPSSEDGTTTTALLPFWLSSGVAGAVLSLFQNPTAVATGNFKLLAWDTVSAMAYLGTFRAVKTAAAALVSAESQERRHQQEDILATATAGAMAGSLYEIMQRWQRHYSNMAAVTSHHHQGRTTASMHLLAPSSRGLMSPFFASTVTTAPLCNSSILYRTAPAHALFWIAYEMTQQAAWQRS